MNATFRAEAPAKLNFTLEILGRRSDGFHELRTVLVPVSLYETVEVNLRGDGAFTCEIRGDGVDASSVAALPPEKNLAVKAALAMRNALNEAAAKGLAAEWGAAVAAPWRGGCHVRVTKRVPQGAGMGGGSADAAGVLTCLRVAWAPRIPESALFAIAAGIGSDIPAMVAGGAVLAEGRGERVRRLVPPGGAAPHMWTVVAFPGGDGLSTKDVFAAWDRQNPSSPALDTQSALWEDCARSVREGDVHSCAETLFNGLQPVVSSFPVPTERFCLALRQGGALKSSMTGSGSAVFGLAESAESAERLRQTLGGETWARVLETLPDGVMAAHGPLVP